MKNFNDPKLELTKLDVEDVICTSYVRDEDEGEDELPP